MSCREGVLRSSVCYLCPCSFLPTLLTHMIQLVITWSGICSPPLEARYVFLLCARSASVGFPPFRRSSWLLLQLEHISQHYMESSGVKLSTQGRLLGKKGKIKYKKKFDIPTAT